MTHVVGLPPTGAAAPLPLERTIAGLRQLRWNTFRNTVAQKLVASRLRLVLVVFFSLLFWFGLFLMFQEGFAFLSLHRIGRPLISGLFGLFFASLLFLLMFSTGIILYAGLFASPEAQFLLVRPIAADRIFAFKFQEAMFFSCWGFFLLGSPMMVAYGLTMHVAWSCYLYAVAYFLVFAMIPGCAGALLCLVITRFMPQKKREVLATLAGALLVAAAWWGWQAWRRMEGPALSHTWVNSLSAQLQLSNLPFLPSHWISSGLLAAAGAGPQFDALFYLLVLLSNALFAYLVTAAAYRMMYRTAYNRVHSSTARKRRPADWLAGPLGWLLAPLPAPIRVLIAKDIRTFSRDPVQWTQVLIFTGLFALYFINLGRMDAYTASPYWRNLIGFFNLAVTGLMMSAFTSRFIFPLLSLEGQKLWILGLCPISRPAILWGKFAFACGGALLVTLSLTLLSAAMLRLEPFLVTIQLATVLILCFGVAGIAVGLGARFPELHEPDPSKIAAGFGGTLNLVASMVFILTVIGTTALPCHLYAITETLQQGSAGLDPGVAEWAGLSLGQFRFWLAASTAVSIVIGILATIIPMRIGIRAFCRMEL